MDWKSMCPWFDSWRRHKKPVRNDWFFCSIMTCSVQEPVFKQRKGRNWQSCHQYFCTPWRKRPFSTYYRKLQGCNEAIDVKFYSRIPVCHRTAQNLFRRLFEHSGSDKQEGRAFIISLWICRIYRSIMPDCLILHSSLESVSCGTETTTPTFYL